MYYNISSYLPLVQPVVTAAYHTFSISLEGWIDANLIAIQDPNVLKISTGAVLVFEGIKLSAEIPLRITNCLKNKFFKKVDLKENKHSASAQKMKPGVLKLAAGPALIIVGIDLMGWGIRGLSFCQPTETQELNPNSMNQVPNGQNQDYNPTLLDSFFV